MSREWTERHIRDLVRQHGSGDGGYKDISSGWSDYRLIFHEFPIGVPLSPSGWSVTLEPASNFYVRNSRATTATYAIDGDVSKVLVPLHFKGITKTGVYYMCGVQTFGSLSSTNGDVVTPMLLNEEALTDDLKIILDAVLLKIATTNYCTNSVNSPWSYESYMRPNGYAGGLFELGTEMIKVNYPDGSSEQIEQPAFHYVTGSYTSIYSVNDSGIVAFTFNNPPSSGDFYMLYYGGNWA